MSDAFKELQRIAAALEEQNAIARAQLARSDKIYEDNLAFHEYCKQRDRDYQLASAPADSAVLRASPSLPAGFQELQKEPPSREPERSDRKKSSRRE